MMQQAVTIGVVAVLIFFILLVVSLSYTDLQFLIGWAIGGMIVSVILTLFFISKR